MVQEKRNHRIPSIIYSPKELTLEGLDKYEFRRNGFWKCMNQSLLPSLYEKCIANLDLWFCLATILGDG